MTRLSAGLHIFNDSFAPYIASRHYAHSYIYPSARSGFPTWVLQCFPSFLPVVTWLCFVEQNWKLSVDYLQVTGEVLILCCQGDRLRDRRFSRSVCVSRRRVVLRRHAEWVFSFFREFPAVRLIEHLSQSRNPHRGIRPCMASFQSRRKIGVMARTVTKPTCGRGSYCFLCKLLWRVVLQMLPAGALQFQYRWRSHVFVHSCSCGSRMFILTTSK